MQPLQEVAPADPRTAAPFAYKVAPPTKFLLTNFGIDEYSVMRQPDLVFIQNLPNHLSKIQIYTQCKLQFSYSIKECDLLLSPKTFSFTGTLRIRYEPALSPYDLQRLRSSLRQSYGSSVICSYDKNSRRYLNAIGELQQALATKPKKNDEPELMKRDNFNEPRREPRLWDFSTVPKKLELPHSARRNEIRIDQIDFSSPEQEAEIFLIRESFRKISHNQMSTDAVAMQRKAEEAQADSAQLGLSDQADNSQFGCSRLECFSKKSQQPLRPTTASRDQAPLVADSERERRANARLLSRYQEYEDEIINNSTIIRSKKIALVKSQIHAYGIFAVECIEKGAFVIEYVGEVIRDIVANLRERKYAAWLRDGSSYLFRIDSNTVIDATCRGNISRFMNHSCDPNCIAKILSIGGRKRICVFACREILAGQEITYDYKFTPEEEKIPCHCGSYNCKGFLN